MTRKLARIAQITDLRPIPNADSIECAVVDSGWEVVVKKGDFSVNETVIYLEVDSWVPHELAPFLSKGNNPREFNGVKGERLKTIRLRGQLSQGLLLPIAKAPLTESGESPAIGTDVAEALGVQKWEAPTPTNLSGNVTGAFPEFVYKTDQERCQNLYKEIFEDRIGEGYEITEKLEGSSMTIYRKEGEVGVCSRNWNLAEDDNNSFWRAAKSSGLFDFLKLEYQDNIAIQGELIGEGVQGNYYEITNLQFHVYDIFDIDRKEYWYPIMRQSFISSLPLPNVFHVPVIEAFNSDISSMSMQDLLSMADGNSSLNPKKRREGLVFKSHGAQFSFKAVSNSYLLKTGG